MSELIDNGRSLSQSVYVSIGNSLPSFQKYAHCFRFICFTHFSFCLSLQQIFNFNILILGCHQTFVSRPGGPMNGTFTGPEFTNYRGLTLSCVYTFLGGPGQRVQITFDTFRLRGAPPE